MQKVFISQPMRGKTDEEILAERELAARRVEKILCEEVEVIDSFFAGADMTKPLEYLGESIKLLARADFAYFVSGWDEARGCQIERMCCSAYDIPYITE